MIGAIIGIIAALVSAGSMIYSAQQQRKTADYRAQLAEEAGEEVKAGTEVDKARAEREGKRLLARQRAMYAKSGVKMEGSPLEVLADTQAELDLDQMIIEHGGQSRASAYERKGMFLRQAGRSAQQASYIRAGASLLESGGKAYSGYQGRQ